MSRQHAVTGLELWIRYWKPAPPNKPRPSNPHTAVEGVEGGAGAIIEEEETEGEAEAGVTHPDLSTK